MAANGHDRFALVIGLALGGFGGVAWAQPAPAKLPAPSAPVQAIPASLPPLPAVPLTFEERRAQIDRQYEECQRQACPSGRSRSACARARERCEDTFEWAVRDLGSGQPTVTGVSPTTARPGSTITIRGSQFRLRRQPVEVHFAGVATPTPVLATSDTSLGVRLPDEAISGPIMVRTVGGEARYPAGCYMGIDRRMPHVGSCVALHVEYPLLTPRPTHVRWQREPKLAQNLSEGARCRVGIEVPGAEVGDYLLLDGSLGGSAVVQTPGLGFVEFALQQALVRSGRVQLLRDVDGRRRATPPYALAALTVSPTSLPRIVLSPSRANTGGEVTVTSAQPWLAAEACDTSTVTVTLAYSEDLNRQLPTLRFELRRGPDGGLMFSDGKTVTPPSNMAEWVGASLRVAPGASGALTIRLPSRVPLLVQGVHAKPAGMIEVKVERLGVPLTAGVLIESR